MSSHHHPLAKTVLTSIRSNKFLLLMSRIKSQISSAMELVDYLNMPSTSFTLYSISQRGGIWGSP